jgi:hypothetical protein
MSFVLPHVYALGSKPYKFVNLHNRESEVFARNFPICAKHSITISYRLAKLLSNSYCFAQNIPIEFIGLSRKFFKNCLRYRRELRKEVASLWFNLRYVHSSWTSLKFLFSPSKWSWTLRISWKTCRLHSQDIKHKIDHFRQYIIGHRRSV